MTKSKATVDEYLAGLPDDRRTALEAIREVILANIDEPFEEGIQYGMIGYYLPHSQYPPGYHCDPRQPLPFAGIASQKRHIGLYLFCIYGNDGEIDTFRDEWQATGKRLDMGKGCVRVTKLADLPLDVLGRAIRRMTAKKFVAHYESSIAGNRTAAKQRASSKAPAKKAPAKKAPAKKTPAKKTPAKKASARKAPAKQSPSKRAPSK